MRCLWRLWQPRIILVSPHNCTHTALTPNRNRYWFIDPKGMNGLVDLSKCEWFPCTWKLRVFILVAWPDRDLIPVSPDQQAGVSTTIPTRLTSMNHDLLAWTVFLLARYFIPLRVNIDYRKTRTTRTLIQTCGSSVDDVFCGVLCRTVDSNPDRLGEASQCEIPMLSNGVHWSRLYLGCAIPPRIRRWQQCIVGLTRECRLANNNVASSWRNDRDFRAVWKKNVQSAL
jgi:hypothetical protein